MLAVGVFEPLYWKAGPATDAGLVHAFEYRERAGFGKKETTQVNVCMAPGLCLLLCKCRTAQRTQHDKLRYTLRDILINVSSSRI
jgi:hypothetical protein